MSSPQEHSFDYKRYWQDTYAHGGNSGSGSYGVLADFKAEVINSYIEQHQLQSVIEFGCGDGNQLSLMAYQNYLGMDIAPSSISICAEKFKEDQRKSFLVYDPKHFVNNGYLKADLVVCLDVLYHITDEDDFQKTLADIFSSARHSVILYTKITKQVEPSTVVTIRDRDIMLYLDQYPQFEIVEIIAQRYEHLSSASFIILQKKANA